MVVNGLTIAGDFRKGDVEMDVYPQLRAGRVYEELFMKMRGKVRHRLTDPEKSNDHETYNRD